MKKVLALLMAVTLGALTVTGCGSGTGSSGTTAAAEGAESTGQESTGNSQAAPASVSADGALKLAVTTGDGSTKDDRIPTPWYNRIMATNLMFRGLFLADSTLTQVKPDLTDTYKVSDDGLTYTITLKDGLKWSDGQPLTVDDVQFSIETALKAATINSIYTAAFKNIASIETDANTITFNMSQPYAAMLDVLAQFAILPKHSLENADPLKLESDPFWTNPVTSGMYALDELKVGNYFTLKINDNYEGAAPNIKKVICYFVSDYVTAAQSGNTDYVFGNAADLVEALRGMSNFTAQKVDVLFYKYFIFNMKGVDGKENPPMENVAVRKALIEAIDRANLATMYPTANVLNSGVPNSSPAYNGFEYKFDADKAKADIQASGYDMSRPLRICYYNNDQTTIDLINIVVYYLEQIGLKVEATLSNDGTTDLFTTRAYDMGFKGKSAFSIDEWYTEYMSTDGLFANVFGGDASFDSLVSQLSKAVDENSRNDILKKLQALEQEKMYKLPAFTVGTYIFTSSNVILPKGVEFCNPLYMCDLDFANWQLAK